MRRGIMDPAVWALRVRALAPLSACDRLVLIYIASIDPPEEPSAATIAEALEISRTSLHRSLRWLRELGLISTKEQKGKPNIHRVTMVSDSLNWEVIPTSRGGWA